MIGNSDRLRILCFVLGNMDEKTFLKAFAEERSAISNKSERGAKRSTKKRSSGSSRSNPEEKYRQTVRGWWSHRHQPRNEVGAIKAVLEAAARHLGSNLDIADLWLEGKYTLTEFVTACGTDAWSVERVVSPVAQRVLFEAIRKFPFLRPVMEAERRTVECNPEGAYEIFRFHSTDPGLCREYAEIGSRSVGEMWTAAYHQYALGGTKRLISVNLCLLDRWLHAFGAYAAPSSEGGHRSALMHAIIEAKVFRKAWHGGFLLDLADEEPIITGQRILIRRLERRPDVMNPELIEHTGSPYKEFRIFLGNSDKVDNNNMMMGFQRLSRVLDRAYARR